jgi:hypothetical protein
LTAFNSSLKQLFEQLGLTPAYPVTVNTAAPPQEPGTAPAPSGPVPCTV